VGVCYVHMWQHTRVSGMHTHAWSRLLGYLGFDFYLVMGVC
jgi:hypothetical protein